jgi:hypothetical protein
MTIFILLVGFGDPRWVPVPRWVRVWGKIFSHGGEWGWVNFTLMGTGLGQHSPQRNSPLPSVVATGEGCTDDTSGQPSSDDHASEAGLSATGRQSYPVSHLVVASLSGAHLHLGRPHRSVPALCYRRRI